MNTTSRLVVGAGLGAPVLLLLPLPVTVQWALSVLLLGVLPGLAMARAARVDDLVLAALVTVTGSLAVTFLVATGLVYFRLWSDVAIAVLVGLVAVAVELASRRWAT